MTSTRLDFASGGTEILVFESGDEFVSILTEYALDHRITAARFTAVGAFEKLTLQYFDWESKRYLDIPIHEQVEALMLSGDIALNGGKPQVHAHAVVGKRTGTAHGGHVKEAFVRPTLELILDRSATVLRKRFDPESGLALIDPATERQQTLGSLL